jgi:outer membrane protein assembly factor BamB
VLTVAVLAAAALVLSSCDWTQFRLGPERSGYSTTESAIGVGNVGSLVEKWTATTGGVLHSSPAVANGVVYVGSEDGKLYAFDAVGSNCSGTPTTCSPLWTATTGGPIDSSPAVVNGVVYVGSNDGNLYAFDAAGAGCSGSPKTCAPLWTAPTGSPVFSSPAVANGVVYVASGYPLTTSVPPGTPAAKLYAFDATGANCTGTPKACAPLWTGTPTGQWGLGTSPAVSNGVVYVGSVSPVSLGQYGGFPVSYLDAFDAAGVGCSGIPKSCVPLWRTPPTVGFIDSSPAAANETVYFPGVPHGDVNSFATVVGFNAAGTTGCSGAPKTCSPVWNSAALSGISPWWNSSPAVANGDVYIGGTPDCPECNPQSLDHNLYAFDATTGVRLWAAPTGAQVLSSPAVANGVVYVGCDDSKLDAFDAAGGAQLWTATTGGAVDSSPAVANGVVYVGSNDGKLYAFGLP